MACRFHSGVYEETRKLRWATKQPKMRPCRHAEAGCPFASDLPAELKRHDRDCAYAPADCPYGCGNPAGPPFPPKTLKANKSDSGVPRERDNKSSQVKSSQGK